MSNLLGRYRHRKRKLDDLKKTSPSWMERQAQIGACLMGVKLKAQSGYLSLIDVKKLFLLLLVRIIFADVSEGVGSYLERVSTGGR